MILPIGVLMHNTFHFLALRVSYASQHLNLTEPVPILVCQACSLDNEKHYELAKKIYNKMIIEGWKYPGLNLLVG